MKEITVSEEKKVKVDFELSDFPRTVKVIKPLVFKDGNVFCCAIGQDPHAGVFGYGNTAKKAIDDWNVKLMDRLAIAQEDDEVAEWVRSLLNRQSNSI
jgi:hypothetical protein